MNKEDKYRILFGDLIGYECINGACITYENSLTHFKYSDIAAKQDDYGFAISHLILGAEELIKALILICLNRNENFIDDAEKEKLFINHSFKHLNIKELFKACSELSVHEYESEALYYLSEADHANKFRFTGYFLNKSLGVLTINEEELDGICTLIDNSNAYKNKGFYVDFRSNWIAPENINKEEYLKYHLVVSKLKNYIEPLFTMPMTDERIQTFIYNE